jgi:hypothetical protein
MSKNTLIYLQKNNSFPIIVSKGAFFAVFFLQIISIQAPLSSVFTTIFHLSAIFQPVAVHTQAFKNGLKGRFPAIFQSQVFIIRYLQAD